MRRAGIPPIGDTGSAIVGRHGGEFFIWSTSVAEEGPITKFSPAGSYQRAQTMEGTEVYSDGVRFVWRVGDLYVWLQSSERGFTINPELVNALAIASVRTRPKWLISARPGGLPAVGGSRNGLCC
jgi:hypothetical protein